MSRWTTTHPFGCAFLTLVVIGVSSVFFLLVKDFIDVRKLKAKRALFIDVIRNADVLQIRVIDRKSVSHEIRITNSKDLKFIESQFASAGIYSLPLLSITDPSWSEWSHCEGVWRHDGRQISRCDIAPMIVHPDVPGDILLEMKSIEFANFLRNRVMLELNKQGRE